MESVGMINSLGETLFLQNFYTLSEQVPHSRFLYLVVVDQSTKSLERFRQCSNEKLLSA
jgi:hypothetical protein